MSQTETEYDWMDEARGLAAQCWCDKETENKVVDATGSRWSLQDNHGVR